jgi:tetratricopeptide (TPR) repeat protein
MSTCPSTEELILLIDEGLDEPRLADLTAHVQRCVPCQRQLEEITRRRLEDIVGLSPDTVASSTHTGRDEDSSDRGLTTHLPKNRSPNTGYRRGGTTAHDPGDGSGTRAQTGLRGHVADHRYPRTGDSLPRIPGYELLGNLGQGGMGVVYLARQIGLNRFVAVKMIRGGDLARPEHFSRFRVEAEAVARLSHPNIIQIHDVGEVDELPFVSLELLEGGNLGEKMAGTPQPGRSAAELLRTLARAIQVAHQAGIVHRDLKPANILFTEEGIPKITDFGLAKRLDSDSRQTETGQIMGSPSYMAPEQARGHARDVGPPADIYALGAILYELLTGRPPFKGETPVETIRQVTDDEVVPPSRLVPRVARDLETICLKCLNKEPSRRYETAQALALDLERFLDGKPIKARPAPLWEHGMKWARRRPLAAACWVLGVSLVCGAVSGLFAYQRSLLRRGQTILASLSQGYGLQRDADAARSDRELDDAQVHLSEFLPLLEMIEDDPRIKDLKVVLVAKREDVKGRLVALRSQQAERERLHGERERFRRFQELLSEALFHDTQFTGLDLPTNQGATRRAGSAALSLYAAPGPLESWALAPLPASLSVREQDEVAEGCYDLLLILADAEVTPEAGLRRLDQTLPLRSPTAAFHLRRASCLDRAGRAAEAEQERRAAAVLKAGTAFDHFLIGQERYKRGDLPAALEHLSAALQTRADHFWGQCLWAVGCLQLHRPSEARSGLNACLQREPGFAWLYLLRGFASYDLAVRGAELAEKLPSQAVALKAEVDRHLDDAASDYRRATRLLDEKPNDELRYALLVNRGVLDLQRRAFDGAEADLQAAIRLNASQLEAHAALALVYQEQSKLDQAFEQYSRAIALRPDSAALYRGRADVELARGDSTSAQRRRGLSDLEKAIRLEQPGNRVLARDHASRARLLVRDHRPTEALAACDAAVGIAGDFEEAHELRLRLLLESKRFNDLIASCDALIARGRAAAGIYELRGLAREGNKDHAGAIEDASTALALSPEKVPLLVRRGWLYSIADAHRLAFHDFDEALRLDPSHADAHAGRGLSRLRLGDHRAAVADAEEALRLGHATARLFYNAGRVYALAAVVAAAEVRKHGQETVQLVARYQDRAVGLLSQALKRMPGDQRATFWREVVQSDPALNALRRRLSAVDLAGPIKVIESNRRVGETHQ